MANILSRRHAPTLARFAASNVLVAFDYDGTLAPIAEDPRAVRMRLRTRRLLVSVAERYPCIVISGRSHADISRRLAHIPVWHVSGNHGLEPWAENPAYAAQVREWVRRLEDRLAPHKGVYVEDKKYSVAIHYRRAHEKRRAVRAINDAVSTLRGHRTVGGKQALNLLPRDSPDKGVALERACRLLVCDKAIYVGDDETDEDAFRAAPSTRLLSIRIGGTGPTRARFRLENQRDIDRLLQALIRLRRDS